MPFDYQAHFERSLPSARVAGEEVVGDCPFCGKAGKLWANRKTGRWICFRCDEGGRAAKLIAELEGITISEAEALIFRATVTARKPSMPESLVEVFGARLAAADDGPVDEPLPSGFAPIWNPKTGKWRMPEYLLKRGVTREAAKHFGIGFCNHGRYGGRVLVPVVCPHGSAWVARAVDEKKEPKYLNPPRAALGRLIMGWDDVAGSDFVIVEGAFDVVRLWQHGIKAVAMLGKRLQPEQYGLLRCMPRDATPTVMLDPEEKAAPLAMATTLARHFERVFVAALPKGVDPGSSTAEQARTALDSAWRYSDPRSSALKALL